MTDHDALLAAVLAHPADDVPRLVFADWLEESGHPAHAARAHYIRHQVEASRHPDGSPDCLALTRKAAALRGSFEDEADPALKGIRLLTALRRRGFLDELRGDWPAVNKAGHAGALTVAPVRLVELTDYHDFAMVHQANWLARLPRLRLSRIRAVDTLVQLVVCPHLAGLDALDLSANFLTDAHLIAFFNGCAAASFADRLRELDLSRTLITDAGANTLAAAGGLGALESVRLKDCKLGNAAKKLLRQRFGDHVAF